MKDKRVNGDLNWRVNWRCTLEKGQRIRQDGKLNSQRENEMVSKLPRTIYYSGYVSKGTKPHNIGGAYEFRSLGEVQSEIWLVKLPT